MLQNRREAHARKEPKVREEDDEPDASEVKRKLSRRHTQL